MLITTMATDDVLVKLSIRHVVYCTCALPLFGFFACVIIASTLHKESTNTHCGVRNFLPSVSAAVGDYTPEKYIWRFCIAYQAFPRVIAALAYRSFYLYSPLAPRVPAHRWSAFRVLCNILCILSNLDNWFILLLTYVSSTENKPVHELAFVGFMACSLLYMLLSLYLYDRSGRRLTSSDGELSFQRKLAILVVWVTCTLICAYCYYRHNACCEPGVWTLFALFEYVVVTCTILFHLTVLIDKPDLWVVVASQSYLKK